jgi:hypothetical protein
VYDLTDYSFYLEAERDEELRKAVEADRADEQISDLELELEVKYMLEMI